MANKRIIILLTVFFIVLGTVFVYYTLQFIRKPSLPIIGSEMNHHIQPFSFINQDGKVITEKDTKGKVCVVEYFYASCKDMCPKMNHNMEDVYNAYKGNKNVLILSHTVDPLRDSAAALKAYSQQYHAGSDQWYFLTGDKQQLYNMARYSYLINADEDTAGVSIDNDFIHDNHYVLVDGEGRIRGFYDGLKKEDIARLIGDIKRLLD